MYIVIEIIVDRIRNTQIRHPTGVIEIINIIKSSKHRWAGHIAGLRDNRWTIETTEWMRRRGRPVVIWSDELCQRLGPILGKDRFRWKQSREGFL